MIASKGVNSKKLKFKRKEMYYAITDDCGNVLSFTLVCDGCSSEELAKISQDVQNEHMGSDGCFH